MLVIGYVGWGPQLHVTRLTPAEQYSHLSLWCLLSAPLLIGCDLERLDPFTLNLLTNDEVLAVDQDALGRSARRVATSGPSTCSGRSLRMAASRSAFSTVAIRAHHHRQTRSPRPGRTAAGARSLAQQDLPEALNELAVTWNRTASGSTSSWPPAERGGDRRSEQLAARCYSSAARTVAGTLLMRTN